MKDTLISLGWVDKGDVLVRFSHPRIGWKPADGTLIIGYHEHPQKVTTMEALEHILGDVSQTDTPTEETKMLQRTQPK